MSRPYKPLQATDLGRRIASARKALGLSQQALADASGVTRVQLARWETGATWPPIPALDKIIEPLGTTYSQLLDER